MQAHAAGNEALWLGVIDAIDEAHELRHDVDVIPRRPKRVLRRQPALGENDEIDIRHAGRVGRRGHHRVDRRVRMIEQHRAHRREAPQIVFVGRVIAMPADDVEGRLVNARAPQAAIGLHVKRVRRFAILVGGDGRQEVARVGQAIRADRPALGGAERRAVVFADVAAGGLAHEFNAEFQRAGNADDLARRRLDDAELGDEAQAPLLGHEHHLAIGVAENLVRHALGDDIDMRGHAGLRARVAGGGHGPHALDEGGGLARQRRRRPAQLARRHVDLVAWRGAPMAGVDLFEPARMQHGRADAVDPRALVGGARRGEGRAAQLFGVEPIGAFLRRVAADRHGARQAFRLEVVAEPGHVFERHGVASCRRRAAPRCAH